ncbi:MAG: UDP-N-acetylmuramoyl-tripeptide--D-alanyl-D-alanine ligase [Bacteroidaceae bacterium]|nr:UDP-N-acetylmuramoyl-tripeptide--D-alanyl-D-alanine ligase [Bacteroidaceae bacterium]
MGSIIIYAVVAFAFFLLMAKYDIHMFQLSSYRYSRYFRWLVPGNIMPQKRIFVLLVFAAAFFPGYWSTGFATGVTIGTLLLAWHEKFKTPLVYTMRVKRLFATDIILFAVVATLAVLFAGKWATAIIGAALVSSNILMLLANLINTPIEKAINRHYYNDAKRIIESHKGLIIIGVTGSFGKTSTKNYLASVLAEKYNVLVTPGNFNTLLGVIRTIREHLRPYHQVFIVEMGAKQKNDIKEICDLVHPTIGIVTAVGEMHLETFKSVENIQDTKFELINSLPANGLGVINFDSEYIKGYKGIKSPCRIIRYAVEGEGDYKATEVKYGASGVQFTLNGEEQYSSRLLGAGNLLNILASVAVADHLGVPVNKQKNAIARLQPVEHRLSMKVANGITVLDDAYNSNPQGAKMALEVLRNFTVGEGNKRIVITPGFVEMGTRQAEANKELGRGIARSCDYAIVVNATNRDAIKSGIDEGGLPSEKYFLADSLNHAHAQLAKILRAGDVVLYENDLPDNFK